MFLWFNSEARKYEYGEQNEYQHARDCCTSLSSIIILERFDANSSIELIKDKVDKLNLHFNNEEVY